MGTQVSVTLWHESPTTANKAIDAVMADMRRLDAKLSPYKETSALAKLNSLAAMQSQTVDDEFMLLLDKAQFISRLSGGAFDITFASVGWYYDYRAQKQPTTRQREKLLPAINYRWVVLDRAHNRVKYNHPNVRIDLGGLAKGYAVDRAASILEEYGVKNATVSAGGDSRVLGDRRGRPWLIGIKNPRAVNDDEADAVIRLPLSDVAVSTSGDYERYFIDQNSGERVHHILNPKTGKSPHELVSVTIIGQQGLDTDPLSTAVFVLGVDRGLALINRLPGFDCVLIDHLGHVHYSAGLMAPAS